MLVLNYIHFAEFKVYIDMDMRCHWLMVVISVYTFLNILAHLVGLT